MHAKEIQVGQEYAAADSASNDYFRAYRVRVVGPLEKEGRHRYGSRERAGFPVEILSSWNKTFGQEEAVNIGYKPGNWFGTVGRMVIPSRFIRGPWEQQVAEFRATFDAEERRRIAAKAASNAFALVRSRWDASPLGKFGTADSGRRTITLRVDEIAKVLDLIEREG